MRSTIFDVSSHVGDVWGTEAAAALVASMGLKPEEEEPAVPVAAPALDSKTKTGAAKPAAKGAKRAPAAAAAKPPVNTAPATAAPAAAPAVPPGASSHAEKAPAKAQTLSLLRHAPDPVFQEVADRHRKHRHAKAAEAKAGAPSASERWGVLRGAVFGACGEGAAKVRRQLQAVETEAVSAPEFSFEGRAAREAAAKAALDNAALAAEGREQLNLAARVAELEKLANRQAARLNRDLPMLFKEVGDLRTIAARSEGRIGRLERQVGVLQGWVAAYPELYEASVRRTVAEPWFAQADAAYGAANLEASGLPARVSVAEAGVGQVGRRLARTQERAVAEAVSTVVGQLVRVGFLRQGKSTGDPDAQFEVNMVTPAAAAAAAAAEADAEPAVAAAGAEGAADALADGAASNRVVMSAPLDLKEVDASITRLAAEVESVVATAEAVELGLRQCVTQETLEKVLDLDSEEARANPEANPLLRMKKGLEESLAASAAAAQEKTAALLRASAEDTAAELASASAALGGRCDDLLVHLTAARAAAEATAEGLDGANGRVSELGARLEALPDPTAQLEALAHGQTALLAADGKLEKSLGGTMEELDGVKIGLQKLSHEFHHTGYCKEAALTETAARLEEMINNCLDNVSNLGDSAGDMRALIARAATMAQVQTHVEKAIAAAAARLQPPDDTAMATSTKFRCLGCNQQYPNMSSRAANPVPHTSLPGVSAGPSTAAPDSRKVYRSQWGVMLAVHEDVNHELERQKKEAVKRAGLSLPSATGREGRLPRAGGLRALGPVHVPWAPLGPGQQQQQQQQQQGPPSSGKQRQRRPESTDERVSREGQPFDDQSLGSGDGAEPGDFAGDLDLVGDSVSSIGSTIAPGLSGGLSVAPVDGAERTRSGQRRPPSVSKDLAFADGGTVSLANDNSLESMSAWEGEGEPGAFTGVPRSR